MATEETTAQRVAHGVYRLRAEVTPRGLIPVAHGPADAGSYRLFREE